MRPPAFLLLAALLVVAASASADVGDGFFSSVDRLHLDHVEVAPGGSRTVEAYFRALADNGSPAEMLGRPDVLVTQDGKPVEAKELVLEQLSEGTRGSACVLALDVSRTMKGEPFDRAKAAAIQFVDGMAGSERLAVLAFGSDTRVVTSFRSDRTEAHDALQALEIDSAAMSTMLYDALHQAVRLLHDDRELPRRGYVIVFSDGEDSGSTETHASVIELAKGGEGRARIPIFTIGYARFGAAGMDALRRLSKDTTGDFFQVSDLGQLPGFLQTISRQIRKSYVVGFPAAAPPGSRDIELRVQGHDDRRAAIYPSFPTPWWWYAGPAALCATLAGAFLLLLLRRSSGRIVFVSGPRSGDSVALRPGVLQIGALAENDIVVASPRVSRIHARLLVDGRRVELEDLGSTNGTEVNDESIQRCRLRPGDRIVLAKEVELEFRR